MGRLIGFVEIHMNVNQVLWMLHKGLPCSETKRNVSVPRNLFHGISDLNRINEFLIWLGHRCMDAQCKNYFQPSVEPHQHHSSYESQPAVVYFFQAGILFSIKNTKFWPILANFGYFVPNLHAFWCTFYSPKYWGGVPKLTNIRYGLQKSNDLWRPAVRYYVIFSASVYIWWKD